MTVLKIVTRSLAQCDLKVIWASWNKTVHAQFASYKFPILPPESVDFFLRKMTVGSVKQLWWISNQHRFNRSQISTDWSDIVVGYLLLTGHTHE